MTRPTYGVKAWQRWQDADPSYAATFSDLETALDAAQLRSEPLIDVFRYGHGIIAARRTVPHPLASGRFVGRDIGTVPA